MIKVEHVETWGFEHAIRGMRNPLNSWSKSDSGYCSEPFCETKCPYVDRPHECGKHFWDDLVIGPNDLNLMRKLFSAGSSHRKYLRQIFVSMDITANHIWWAEFDTYKVGVTRNSCSKMHKIHVKEFEPDDFSHEGIDACDDCTKEHFKATLEELERLRLLFNATGEKRYWRALLELLPMGYNLKATVTMNYENAINIIEQRSSHKMFEWEEFVDVLMKLPHVEAIING